MNYKTLKEILLAVYSLPMVKKILSPNVGVMPDYRKMLFFRDNHGIPLDAWENIRAWLAEQELKQKQKAEKRKAKGAKDGNS